jgi:hydroxymethylbilane synthase
VRLGLTHRISSRLSPDKFPYAVGQGALGIEVRSNDQRILPILRSIEHQAPRWTCLAERSLLRHLQGGCSSPIGVASSISNEDVIVDGVVTVRLYGTVIHPHGKTDVKADAEMHLQSDEDAEALGRRVADLLLENGAGEILAEIKASRVWEV